MSLSISISTAHFELAFGPASNENIRIGPVVVYLGWAMQGITWKGRFDLLCEKSSYRPHGGKRFEVWKDSEEERGGYFLGRVWNLQTGSRMAG